MDINKFINQWLEFSNAYDTQNYLAMWQEDGILKDPSIGQNSKGHEGIKEYFETYFIGYRTQTKLISLDIISENKAHLLAEFSGDFSESKFNGTFDFTFKDGKIIVAKADLV